MRPAASGALTACQGMSLRLPEKPETEGKERGRREPCARGTRGGALGCCCSPPEVQQGPSLTPLCGTEASCRKQGMSQSRKLAEDTAMAMRHSAPVWDPHPPPK